MQESNDKFFFNSNFFMYCNALSVKKSVLKKLPTLALDRLDSDLDLDVFQDKSVEIRG